MSKNKVKNRSQRAKKSKGKRRAKAIKIADTQRRVAESRKPKKVELTPQVRTKREEPIEPLNQDMQKQIMGAKKRGMGANAAKSAVAKMMNATSTKEHKSQDN